MALTPEKIHAAADQIAEGGERPTLARIRKALDGGSFTTISDAMKDWRSQQTHEHALAEIEVPASINNRIEQLKAAVWESAVQEAESRLSIERAALEEAQAAASAEVGEAKEAVQTLENEAFEHELELEKLREQFQENHGARIEEGRQARDLVQKRDAEIIRLGERGEGLEARLKDARDSQQKAETREVAAAQDAQLAKDQQEALRHQLSEAERAVATAEARAQERSEAVTAEQEAREAEAKEAKASIQRSQEQHKNELGDLRDNLNGRMTTLEASAKAANDDLKARLKAAEKSLEEARSEAKAAGESRVKAEAKAELLSERLADLDKRLYSDKNEGKKSR